jgi:hypothetical protein
MQNNGKPTPRLKLLVEITVFIPIKSQLHWAIGIGGKVMAVLEPSFHVCLRNSGEWI